MRRHTMIDHLVAEGWPVALLDLGGQVRRYGEQANVKFGVAIGSLAQIGYQAIGFGPQDLRLPVEELIGVSLNNDLDGQPRFVSANVGLLEYPSDDFVAPYRVIEIGGRKIGVTAILGPSYQEQINNDDIRFVTPSEGLQRVLPKLQEEADFLVLLSHARPEQTKALAAQFPQFDVVVTAGGADEPPHEAALLNDDHTRLVEVGHKGMYVAVLGLYDDPALPIRYQRVPLDARFKDSSEMHQALVDYQFKLQELGLENLTTAAIPHPRGTEFVGSDECLDCHSRAGAKWKNTPHAHATETLVKLDPPRQYDPECLSCHSTGWEPQKYFPYASGFRSLQSTPYLAANGCENCHGPGQAHVDAESGLTDATQEELLTLRKTMQLPLAQAEAKCLECHDHDNSPEFEFETYWLEVVHRGKD